jgi:hypothetical protein
MGMSVSRLHLDPKLNRSDQIELEALPSNQQEVVLNVKELLQLAAPFLWHLKLLAKHLLKLSS